MTRFLLAALAACALTATARADRIGPYVNPVERALRSPVVVVGTVTAIEKDPVEAALYPGGPKVAYNVAVVKVSAGLAGADRLTHIKVGFVTAAAEKGAGLRPGRGPNNPELKEGQEWLFFVTKHPDGGFHTIPYMTPPVESKAEGYKDQIARVTRALAAVADPAKALKAEKAGDRFEAAVAILYRLRTVPEGTRGEVENVPLGADESRQLLQALAGGTWKPAPASAALNGLSAFAMLGLTEKDGWKPVAPAPGEDFAEATRKAFAEWLAGPGKDYRVKKLVPKK